MLLAFFLGNVRWSKQDGENVSPWGVGTDLPDLTVPEERWEKGNTPFSLFLQFSAVH